MFIAAKKLVMLRYAEQDYLNVTTATDLGIS